MAQGCVCRVTEEWTPGGPCRRVPSLGVRTPVKVPLPWWRWPIGQPAGRGPVSSVRAGPARLPRLLQKELITDVASK